MTGKDKNKENLVCNLVSFIYFTVSHLFNQSTLTLVVICI